MTSTFGKRILRGLSILTSRDLLVALMGALRVVLITQWFTLAEFGTYSLALGTAMIAAIFVMPQFNNVVQRFYPEYQKNDPSQAGRLIFSTMIYTVLNAALVAFALFALSEWIVGAYYQKPEALFFVQVGLSLILFQPLGNVLTAFLMSMERFKTLFVADILQALIGLSGVVAIGAMGEAGNVTFLIMSFVLAVGVRTLWCLGALVPKVKVGRPYLGAAIRRFWMPFMGSSFFKALTGDLPTIILGRLLTTAELGIFQIADKTVRMIFGLIDPYVATVSVICLNAYQEARNKFAALLNRHFKWIGMAFLFMTGAAVIGARPVFDLVYGAEYIEAVPIFVILCFYPFWGGMMFYQRIIYSVTNKTDQYFYFVLISAVFQLPLLWFAAEGYGLVGAAVAMVLMRVFGFGLAMALTRRVMPKTLHYMPLVLPFAVNAGLWAAAIYWQPSTFPPAIAMGMIYTVLFAGMMGITASSTKAPRKVVLFFGSYDPHYPRTWTLFHVFRHLGFDILEINCKEKRGWDKYRFFWREFTKVRGKFSLVVVPFQGFVFFPVIRLLTRKPILFDAFISRFETNTDDRGYHKAWSLRGRYDYFLDWLPCHFAQLMLVDTLAFGRYFQKTFGCPAAKIHRFWTGTNRERCRPVTGTRDSKKFVIGFQGKAVARITGLEYLVEAMERLKEHRDIVLRIIGPEEKMGPVKALIKEKRLTNIEFTGWILQEKLSDALGACNVIVGSFGNTEKLKKAIPLKIWDGLAMGKPLLVGDTPGVREAFTDNEHLVMARLADARDIAGKILELKEDRIRLERIGRCGHEYFKTRFSIARIAGELEKKLEAMGLFQRVLS